MPIPYWKIRRELRRFAMQIGSLPWLLVAQRRKRAYDKAKADLITLTQGQAERTRDLAILLLYQPDGILKSTLHTLDHFAAQGISCMVVSNTPLKPADRDALAHRAWQVMERPNYGYDFGGYRDAILHVLDSGYVPENLFVLNDSIWFPLQDDSDLVAEARAAEEDLYGFVFNDRVRGTHRRHIQSYFFRFGPNATSSPKFKAYWHDLFLSNNKYLVVRRCEIPMTAAFGRLGFSVSARHRYSDGADALRTLDNDTLRQVIAYQAKVDTRNAPWLEAHLHEGPMDEAWRAKVEADITAGRLDKYFLIVHPSVLIGQLKAPLLKRDRQSIYQLQRAELIDRGLDANFARCVREEIEAWDHEGA